MSLADLIRDLSASLKPPEEKPRIHGCHYVVEGQKPDRGDSDHRGSDQHRKPSPPAALKEPESVAAPAPIRAWIARGGLQDRETLIQAMITREILDKPLALRRRR